MVTTLPSAPFVHAVRLRPRRLGDEERDYTDELPALAEVERLTLSPARLVLRRRQRQRQVDARRGDRRRERSSTPRAAGGCSRSQFATRSSHSTLHEALVLEGSKRKPLNAFFLRAESFFNFATAVERARHDRAALRSSAARAVARRVVPRARAQPLRAERPLRPRRARGRALGPRPARADASDARARRARVAVRHRDALADPARLPGRVDLRADRGRDSRDRVRRRAASRAHPVRFSPIRTPFLRHLLA